MINYKTDEEKLLPKIIYWNLEQQIYFFFVDLMLLLIESWLWMEFMIVEFVLQP